MALELIKTGKLTIKSLGIKLTQKSTEKELKRALELDPSLSAYIVENKTIKKDDKKKIDNETGNGKT